MRHEEVAYDYLTLLDRLSNIDKHRRVHLVASWPALVYWGSDEPSRLRWRWGQPPFNDGTILGRLYQDPQHTELVPETLQHDMQLRVLRPPEAAVNDIVSLLRGIHRDVVHRVIPGVLMPQPTDGEGHLS